MWRYGILVLFLGFLIGWFALRFDPRPVFTEGVAGQPVDLIPGQGPANLIDETLERLLFRSLFGYDAGGQIVPDLAESYEVSRDGRVYTVTLKEAFWRDGRQVSSADVAFTFTRDPAFAKVGIKQEGERQIIFELESPLGSFLSVLTRPVAPANFLNLKFELLGNSDFVVERVGQEGETITEIILRHRGGGQVKALRFKFYRNEEELLKAAAVGEMDALSSLGFTGPSFAKYQVPVREHYFGLFFNLKSGNRLVRDAGFRKAAASRTPLPADSTPVNGPFSGTWAEGSFNFPRFTDKAGSKFSGDITLTVVNSNGFPELAEEIASSWKRNLGVTVKIQAVAPAEMDRIVSQREFEAIILGQQVGRDPDRYSIWHSSQSLSSGQNISGYGDPRADRALEEGRKAGSRSARRTHYVNFQRLFFENNPAVLLYHPNFNYWVSRRFTGIDLEPIFAPKERFWNFESWRLAFSGEAGE